MIWQEAINTLPFEFREVWVLREVGELSIEEIAEITGLPLGTVKSRLHRARAKMRVLTDDYPSKR